MSQESIKKLIIFLLISFLLSIVILLSVFFKAKNNQEAIEVKVVEVSPAPVHIDLPKPTPMPPTKQQPILPNPQALNPQQNKNVAVVANQANTVESKSSSSVDIVKSTPVSVPAITTENDKVCVVYGPLDIEKKGTMDVILNKFKQNSLVKVDKKVTYLIYWNLGSDKIVAEKLFNRLKENGGALSDQKFVLSKNDNNDYVVNIIRVNSGKTVAERLTNDLINKANKVKTGGQWQYKALPEGYFYTFPDYSKLNPKAIESINIMVEAAKDPCWFICNLKKTTQLCSFFFIYKLGRFHLAWFITE